MWDEFLNSVVPLLLAAFLGGVLGFDRELRGHWAGLRTHMLVSIGSALFVLAGAQIPGANAEAVSRIIQGVATGIGFIGAGTIVKLSDKLEVKGLTTSASIWIAGAIGIASALHHYVLAVSGALLGVIVLSALQTVEKPADKTS